MDGWQPFLLPIQLQIDLIVILLTRFFNSFANPTFSSFIIFLKQSTYCSPRCPRRSDCFF